MTGFILQQMVDYEGANFLGVFNTIEEALDFLKASPIYSEDIAAFLNDETPEVIYDEHMDQWPRAPINTSGCWRIDGIHDVTFYIYSFALLEQK